MSLVGTYTNKTLGAKLDIKEANNSNGQGSGTFSIGGQSYEVAIHYHFENNVGPTMVMQIWTSNTYGWDYVGAAASSASTDGSAGLLLAGGVASTKATNGFSGMFTK